MDKQAGSWEKAFLLAGVSKDKARKLSMTAANFEQVKDRRCPRCSNIMGDVLLASKGRTAMYCSQCRVVLPHPVMT